jgi:predicted metal-dependent peptidase
VAVSQAAQQAKACGNLPGALARFANGLVHPKLNPYDILRQFLEMTAKNDYAWNPPNRRYLSLGFYLPSLNSLELPEIVIAVDTSGSISDEDLAQFAAEISGILEAYETTINVIYCDTEINGPAEIFTREDLPLTLQARGGGGTDFRPPFKWVADQGLTPACLIYLTDLACNRYPLDPGYPVLWAKIGNWSTTPPPFGDVVEID